MIHHSREHVSSAVRFTQLQPTLATVQGDFRLVCGCLAKQTQGMCNSSCADVSSRSSLERFNRVQIQKPALTRPVV